MKLNWGTGIVLAYAVFAAATLGFAVFAMEQPVELVSADYYQRALDHDGRMAAEVNAARLGDRFRIDADPAAKSLTLTWSVAAPDSGRLTLYRASGAAQDRVVPIAATAGRQVIGLDGLEAGRWHVQVQWRHAELDYYVERTIALQ